MNAPRRGWSLSRESFCLHLTRSRTNLLLLCLTVALERALLAANLHIPSSRLRLRGGWKHFEDAQVLPTAIPGDSSVAGGNHQHWETLPVGEGVRELPTHQFRAISVPFPSTGCDITNLFTPRNHNDWEEGDHRIPGWSEWEGNSQSSCSTPW